MKIAVALFLFIHGFAHIVGFVVYWRIMKVKDVEYKTTIFPGSMNVGDGGIKFIGFVYLISALAFGFMGYDLLTNGVYFWEYIWTVTMVSTVLCITGWPDTKLGILTNVILIVFLAANEYFTWLQ